MINIEPTTVEVRIVKISKVSNAGQHPFPKPKNSIIRIISDTYRLPIKKDIKSRSIV